VHRLIGAEQEDVRPVAFLAACILIAEHLFVGQLVRVLVEGATDVPDVEPDAQHAEDDDDEQGDEHLAPYALLLAGSLLVFGLVVEEIVEGGVVRHRHSGVMSVRDSRRRGGNGNLGNYIAFVTMLRTPRCRRPTFVRLLPGALKFALAGLVARMPVAVLGLGIVLFIQGVSGSYGLAGIVTAVYMIVQALAGPGIARFVDRYGQARVMTPIVIIHLVSLTLLIFAVYGGWWTGFIYLFAGLGGATVGSVGSLVRSRWSHIVDSPKKLQTAFSWESVADELMFVSGPVIATVLATAV